MPGVGVAGRPEAYPTELKPDEIHVWSCRLDALDPDPLRSILSPEEQQRADRFRFDQHRNDFIAAHAFLRFTLARYTGLHAVRLEFDESSHQKPLLRNGGRLQFNLSHSGRMALLAITLDREVGVDLERIRPIPDLESIARRFFAPGERDDLLRLAPHQREAAFFRCWTRKEAFVKAIGHGLLHPLDRFRVTLLPEQAAAFVEIDGSPAEQTNWALHEISPCEGYVAAVAIEARNMKVSLCQQRAN